MARISVGRRFFEVFTIAGAVAALVSAGLGRADAANLRARASSPIELALSSDGVNGSQVSLGAVFAGEDVTWETSDGLLWHRLIGPVTPGPATVSFGLGVELSMAVPYFDYNRAAAYELQSVRMGNEFQWDEFRVLSNLQPTSFVVPHDLSKEYVAPIGGLPRGDYSAVARSFSIVAPNPADIDFDAFRTDPMGYTLPAGATLRATAGRINFSVVPEPGTAGLMLGGAALVAAASRRRRA